MVNQQFEKEHPRRTDGTFRDKNGNLPGQLPDEETGFDEDERLSTLLEEHLPLDFNRRMKVPTLDPDDDSVKARTKLGRYLYNSLDENADRESLADETVYALWPDATRYDGDDSDVALHMRLDEEKTGSKDIAYELPDERYLFVNLGPHKAAVNKFNYRFRKSGRDLDTTNLADMLATREIVNGMDELGPDPSDTIRTILDDDRRSWSHYKLNIKGMPNADQTIAVIEKKTGIKLGPPSDDLDDAKKWWNHAKSIVDKYEEENKDRPYDEMRIIQTTVERAIPQLDMVGPAKSFRNSVSNILNTESNVRANRDWQRKQSSETNATVFVDKKHQDPAHVEAGRNSSFAKDFGHIEIDNDVDLERFKALGSEYSKYKHLLPPQTETANLRFRYTGRHNATGVYHPGFVNIAVDPRHPASFTHEYFHHMDFTKSDHELSLDPDFKPILDHCRATVDREQMAGTNPDRYLAPTEVFARCAETWMSRHGGDGSSFLESKETYQTQFDYVPFKGYENQIDRLFGRLFG